MCSNSQKINIITDCILDKSRKIWEWGKWGFDNFIPVFYKIFVWSRIYCIPNHQCQSFKLDYTLKCSFSNTYQGLKNFKSFYDVKANIWQLDYCSALYMELLLKITKKLHLLQSAVAWAVTGMTQDAHITPLFCRLQFFSGCDSTCQSLCIQPTWHRA